jgi:hypothetical protein
MQVAPQGAAACYRARDNASSRPHKACRGQELGVSLQLPAPLHPHGNHHCLTAPGATTARVVL